MNSYWEQVLVRHDLGGGVEKFVTKRGGGG